MPRTGNPFFTLYRHRDLVVQFTQRELELRHKGSRLGHLWSILKPLSMLVLYVFIFGKIFNGKFGVIANESTFDYALGIFMGLSLFNVIGEVIGAAPLLIINQPNFVKKVVFPLEVIPLSNVVTSVYHSFLSLILLLAIAPFSHSGVSWQGALALPILVLPLAFMALGIAWGLAAVGVFLRDVSQLVPFVSTAIMYGSAVVYSPSRLPAAFRPILRFNPLLQVIDEARSIVLWHMAPHYAHIAYSYLAAAVMLAAGYAVFSILRPYFAEVI
jgi:lipopolysaccharide transport system permease protein